MLYNSLLIASNENFSLVSNIIIIVRGITTSNALVNILAACILVRYSSSILIISNLLLSFNKYLFKKGGFID